MSMITWLFGTCFNHTFLCNKGKVKADRGASSTPMRLRKTWAHLTKASGLWRPQEVRGTSGGHRDLMKQRRFDRLMPSNLKEENEMVYCHIAPYMIEAVSDTHWHLMEGTGNSCVSGNTLDSRCRTKFLKQSAQGLVF